MMHTSAKLCPVLMIAVFVLLFFLLLLSIHVTTNRIEHCWRLTRGILLCLEQDCLSSILGLLLIARKIGKHPDMTEILFTGM